MFDTFLRPQIIKDRGDWESVLYGKQQEVNNLLEYLETTATAMALKPTSVHAGFDMGMSGFVVKFKCSEDRVASVEYFLGGWLNVFIKNKKGESCRTFLFTPDKPAIDETLKIIKQSTDK
ncbi:MAG: hypothetical protein GY861_01260 [bacterium]|nr:hypothetical protein [bacterium]